MVFACAAVSAAQKPRQPPTGDRAVYLHSQTAAFIRSISGNAPPVQDMAGLCGCGFSPGGVGGGPKAVRPPRPPPPFRGKTKGGLSCESCMLPGYLHLAFISWGFWEIRLFAEFHIFLRQFSNIENCNFRRLLCAIKFLLLSRYRAVSRHYPACLFIVQQNIIPFWSVLIFPCFLILVIFTHKKKQIPTSIIYFQSFQIAVFHGQPWTRFSFYCFRALCPVLAIGLFLFFGGLSCIVPIFQNLPQ